MAFKSIFFGLILTLCTSVQAEVLFEAFYRLERGGRHTGYVVQRVSSDKGLKTVSTYVRSRQGDEEVFVTSKSVAQAGAGTPVETIHSSNNSGAPYRIHAKFNKGKGTVSFFSNNSRKANLVETAQPSPFPIAFLFYAGDLSKFETGKKYSYTAFAEEAGRMQIGWLSVLNSKEAGGKRVLQLLNDDSGQPVENFVNENGHPLGARSVATDSVCFWVATKEEAVGDMTYPTGEMTALFGDLPQGKKNPWIKQAKFKSYDLITSFPKWDGERHVSSQSTTGTLMLPLRGI